MLQFLLNFSGYKHARMLGHFEIWYSILICFYLGSRISYRKVFVLQTELWISSFKWIMSQHSNLVAREIKQKLKRKFSEFFWPTLYNSFQFSIHISISWKSNLTNWPTDYLTVFQKPLYIILIINLSKVFVVNPYIGMLATHYLSGNCSAWSRRKLNTKIGLNHHHHHPPTTYHKLF